MTDHSPISGFDRTQAKEIDYLGGHPRLPDKIDALIASSKDGIVIVKRGLMGGPKWKSFAIVPWAEITAIDVRANTDSRTPGVLWGTREGASEVAQVAAGLSALVGNGGNIVAVVRKHADGFLSTVFLQSRKAGTIAGWLVGERARYLDGESASDRQSAPAAKPKPKPSAARYAVGCSLMALVLVIVVAALIRDAEVPEGPPPPGRTAGMFGNDSGSIVETVEPHFRGWWTWGRPIVPIWYVALPNEGLERYGKIVFRLTLKTLGTQRVVGVYLSKPRAKDITQNEVDSALATITDELRAEVQRDGRVAWAIDELNTDKDVRTRIADGIIKVADEHGIPLPTAR